MYIISPINVDFCPHTRNEAGDEAAGVVPEPPEVGVGGPAPPGSATLIPAPPTPDQVTNYAVLEKYTYSCTGCALNIVFFSKNSRKFATSPSSALLVVQKIISQLGETVHSHCVESSEGLFTAM